MWGVFLLYLVPMGSMVMKYPRNLLFVVIGNFMTLSAVDTLKRGHVCECDYKPLFSNLSPQKAQF